MDKAIIINDMIGRTFVSIDGGEKGSEELLFTATSGKWVKFYHSKDCCESVDINEIHGDIADLLDSPMLQAEEVSSADIGKPPGEYVESYTWTFYKFATIKGSVTFRWLGESNGYYSEEVAVCSSEHPRGW